MEFTGGLCPFWLGLGALSLPFIVHIHLLEIMISSIGMFLLEVYLVFGEVVFAHDAVLTAGKRIAVKLHLSSGG